MTRPTITRLTLETLLCALVGLPIGLLLAWAF